MLGCFIIVTKSADSPSSSFSSLQQAAKIRELHQKIYLGRISQDHKVKNKNSKN